MSDNQQQPPAEAPQQPATQNTPPPPAPQGAGGQIPGADKKMLAGILGILFGSFGVHKFVLGYQKEGIILLSCTIGGYVLGFIGSIFIIGCVFFILPFATAIIGIIEGVIYLTKSDEEFVNTYITHKKPWF